jgi:hypothetical protein
VEEIFFLHFLGKGFVPIVSTHQHEWGELSRKRTDNVEWLRNKNLIDGFRETGWLPASSIPG